MMMWCLHPDVQYSCLLFFSYLLFQTTFMTCKGVPGSLADHFYHFLKPHESHHCSDRNTTPRCTRSFFSFINNMRLLTRMSHIEVLKLNFIFMLRTLKHPVLAGSGSYWEQLQVSVPRDNLRKESMKRI